MSSNFFSNDPFKLQGQMDPYQPRPELMQPMAPPPQPLSPGPSPGDSAFVGPSQPPPQPPPPPEPPQFNPESVLGPRPKDYEPNVIEPQGMHGIHGVLSSLRYNDSNAEADRIDRHNLVEEWKANQSRQRQQAWDQQASRLMMQKYGGTPVFVQGPDGEYQAIYPQVSGPGAGKPIKGAVPGGTVTQEAKPEPVHSQNLQQALVAAYESGDMAKAKQIVDLIRQTQPSPAPMFMPVVSPTQGVGSFNQRTGQTQIDPNAPKDIQRVGGGPKGPTAAQTEGIVGLNNVIAQVKDVKDELDNVTGGEPPTSGPGQLLDAAKQRAAEFGYNSLGVTSDRSKLIQKVAFLKAERTKSLLKGVRNQKYIDQIWKHMPDENKDSTSLMAEKLNYVEDKLNDALREETAAAQNPQAYIGKATGVPEQTPSVQMAPQGNQPQFKSEIEFRKAYARDHNGVQPSPDKVARAKSLGMF